jgi:hypothetical protein
MIATGTAINSSLFVRMKAACGPLSFLAVMNSFASLMNLSLRC